MRRGRELRKALAAAEQDLVRAERLAAIGEMTVTLHHEINNPLMSAFADVELLLNDIGAAAGDPEAGPGGHPAGAPPDPRHRAADRQAAGDPEQGLPARESACWIWRRKSTEAPVLQRGTALLHLPDEDLTRIVSLLLRGAGFQVERCASIAELQASAARIGVTVVVIAGGGQHARGAPPGRIRRRRKIASTCWSHWSLERARCQAAGADHVVHLPFDPGTFTAEIAAPADSRLAC